MKTKINLSLDPETADALRVIATARHTTLSQLVTDWVWAKYRVADQRELAARHDQAILKDE